MKIYIVVAMTRSRSHIYNDVMHSITALCYDRKTATKIRDAKNARTKTEYRASWLVYVIKTKEVK